MDFISTNLNFIKRHFKHVIMSTTVFFFILILGLGIGLSAFGMGMESKRFINSVEKTIDNYIPKGNVVIDGSKGIIYALATTKLKESYTTDILSTLTEAQQKDPATKSFWQNYANNKFNSRWKSVIDKKEDIDINEFSHALVAFDMEIAEKFHNYGFTHSGLQWIGQKGVLSDLWNLNYKNTNTYQEAQQNQTLINPSEYTNGTYLVNNKVWFINEQIKTLAAVIDFAFKDKDSAAKTLLKEDENGQTVPVQVSMNDFYHPNYTSSFEQTRTGSIFLVILTPMFGVIFISINLFNYYFLKNILEKKNKKIKIINDKLELNEVELLN